MVISISPIFVHQTGRGMERMQVGHGGNEEMSDHVCDRIELRNP